MDLQIMVVLVVGATLLLGLLLAGFAWFFGRLKVSRRGRIVKLRIWARRFWRKTLRKGFQSLVPSHDEEVVVRGFFGDAVNVVMGGLTVGLIIISVLLFPLFPVAGGISLALAFALAMNGFYIIPEKEAWVIEFLGQYSVSKYAGFHFILPFFMKVRERWFMGQQTLLFTMNDEPDKIDNIVRGMVETKDASIGISAGVVIQIKNTYKATYVPDDLKPALLEAVEDSVRSALGQKTLDEIIAAEDELADEICERHRDQVRDWGTELIRFFLKDPQLPPEIRKQRDRRIEAETEKQFRVRLAEGDKEAIVLRAEGQKKADELRGEGEGARIKNAVVLAELTPEQIAGFNLSTEQAQAFKQGTNIFTLGSGDTLGIPAATAQVQRTLDALRGNGGAALPPSPDDPKKGPSGGGGQKPTISSRK